ncbi:MATE family efflux transporter [Bacillus lacus]|uniref:MATE family efflux transporter n=1 Tax=Metabacillus lacus TaxID=1983721 RepID=A0A7X2J1E3_9BACI|nr:MATE family efflux transporter [Metabacillus lacus]MRX73499.1 MATE family efflux transporter [Metabacillus lacus]
MIPENKNRKLTLFALTWPIFIEIFLHMLMGNADTLMLSQYSDGSVAAVGVANQFLYLLIVMFGFVATGSSILITQHLGANEKKSAAEISLVSLVANLLFGLAIGMIVFMFSEEMLQLMNLPQELMPEAVIYLQVVGGLSVIQAVVMTIGAILRSYSFTKDTMYVTIGMNILNVIGNYLFIFGPFGIPVLGVEGVAISTVISRIIGLAVIIYLLMKRVTLKTQLNNIKVTFKLHLKNLLVIGVPSAGEHLAYNIAQMILTFFITLMAAEHALTTKVYAQNIMMLVFLFSAALSQGTQILIGYMIGGRQYEEAYRRCMKSLYLGVSISTVLAILFSLGSDTLFSIFTSNPDIIAVGGTLMLLTIILEPGRAFNLVIISSLRAAGDVKFPVYMGILSMFGVQVPIAYYFGIHLGYGLAGIWIAFIVDEWLRGIIMLFRWRSRIWVHKGFIQTAESRAVTQ